MAALASSLMLMLSGCADGNRFAFGVPVPKDKQVDKVSRDLPAAPSYMAPAKSPEIKAGEDARVALAREREFSKSLNSRLYRSRRWYGGVRGSFKSK